MNKLGYRAVFILVGSPSREIHQKLVEVYKESAFSFLTGKKEVIEFKCVRTSFEGDPCEERRKMATADENI